jgi:hypothetical protein
MTQKSIQAVTSAGGSSKSRVGRLQESGASRSSVVE